MTTCACGRDHAKDRDDGAERERLHRVDRWGEPFETITGSALLRNKDAIELRATQGESGAWEASVYVAEYAPIATCEVGTVEFTGYAATEERAKALARQAVQTLLAKWAVWREAWAREDQERRKAAK